MDIAFLDKAAYWSLFAYVTFVCLALVTSAVVLVVSYRRSAAMQSEIKRLQTQSQEQAAAANRLVAEANEKIAASNALAAQAQSEAASVAASAAVTEAQLRKENLQLSTDLAREKQAKSERAAAAAPAE